MGGNAFAFKIGSGEVGASSMDIGFGSVSSGFGTVDSVAVLFGVAGGMDGLGGDSPQAKDRIDIWMKRCFMSMGWNGAFL